MFPHDGVGGRTPTPRIASAPSATIAIAMPSSAIENIAGNTFGFDVRSIQPVIRDDLAMLASPGQVATARRTLTLVSHPGTIDETERAASEMLFNAFAPLRYETDSGPLRFVTLAQVAAAYSR